MSLNITIVSRDIIYQSGDFRFVDRHGKRVTFEAQKQIQITRYRWSAVVAYVGIGSVKNLIVSDWLTDRVGELPPTAGFGDLIDVLLSADGWIRRAPLQWRCHTFSVGAFIGYRPLFALVSNFEAVHQRPSRRPRPKLRVTYLRPGRERVIVTGRPHAVTRIERLSLVGYLRAQAAPDAVMKALGAVNASAHERDDDYISAHSLTSFIRLTGEGGSALQGGAGRLSLSGFMAPREIAAAMSNLMPQGRVEAVSTMRSPANAAEHLARIREKPDDPSLHNNYGAYLRDVIKDDVRAEQEYLRALELDPDHALALGNLASLVSDRGDLDRAEDLRYRAVAAAPRDDNQRANLVEFLRRQRGDVETALRVCEAGTPTASDHPHLVEEHGLLLLLKGEYARAAVQYERVYKMRPDLAGLAFSYGTALQCSGAPPVEVEPLYRQVLAQEPEHAPAKLNLAQVRFQLGATEEAIALIRQALKGALDEGQKVEALFSWFAFENTRESLRELRVLLRGGARSKGWDLAPVITKAVALGHEEAALLRVLADVVIDVSGMEALDQFPVWRELD